MRPQLSRRILIIHRQNRRQKNTYSIHQYAATWFSDKQKIEKKQIGESYKFVMERIGEGK